MTMSLENVYRPKLDRDTLLYVRDLKVWFPLRRGFKEIITMAPTKYVKAVDGISFAVGEGEVFALVGESGCGKTTTGRAILRLVEPDSGVVGYKPSENILKKMIEVEGGDVLLETKIHIDVMKVSSKNMKHLRQEMQIVFQDPYASLNPRQLVLSALMEPLEIHRIGSSREERIEIVAKALEMVKLTPPEDFMYRYPHQLSGGQRQRVVIARAIILKPRFIVADEPLSMLDVSIRTDILKLMIELKNKLGLSYLFITHDLALTRYIANKIAVMYLGKIVEIGPVEKILSNPLHPYTKALIKAIPEPDPSRRKELKELEVKGEVPSAIDIPPGCRFHPRCIALDANPQLANLCKVREPPLIEVEKDHYVACWLYRKT
jgi:peptide/nickel transport system ATP-binding protein